MKLTTTTVIVALTLTASVTALPTYKPRPHELHRLAKAGHLFPLMGRQVPSDASEIESHLLQEASDGPTSTVAEATAALDDLGDINLDTLKSIAFAHQSDAKQSLTAIGGNFTPGLTSMTEAAAGVLPEFTAIPNNSGVGLPLTTMVAVPTVQPPVGQPELPTSVPAVPTPSPSLPPSDFDGTTIIPVLPSDAPEPVATVLSSASLVMPPVPNVPGTILPPLPVGTPLTPPA